MFHARIEPTIHPLGCGCSDCAYEVELDARRRALRGDLLVLALGLAAALAPSGCQAARVLAPIVARLAG
jgi:hypothetical protein